MRLVPRAQALRALESTGTFRCPALTDADRCLVYQDRPTICRLFGVQQAMRCPHGCRPDDELLDDTTGLQLLVQSLHAGGDSGQLGDGPLPTPQAIETAMRTPAVRDAVQDLLRGL